MVKGTTNNWARPRAGWVTELDGHDVLRFLLRRRTTGVAEGKKKKASALASYNTALVTSSGILDSSLTASLMSKSNKGSSSNSQGGRVFQDDEPPILVRLIAELVCHCKRRTELVF